MSAKTQAQTIIGMDAHSQTISLCVMEWIKGEDPVAKKRCATDVRSLIDTYRNQRIPKDSTTIIEASGNSFSLARRLESEGWHCEVVNSDIASGMARSDRINDRIDAENIAVAYARRKPRTVYQPTEKEIKLRNMFSVYNVTKTSLLRTYNHIWAYCNQHGLSLPKRYNSIKPETLKTEIESKGILTTDEYLLKLMFDDFKMYYDRKSDIQDRMRKCVLRDDTGIKAMEVLGIGVTVAFALLAHIGSIDRFESPKKLVSYLGLNPSVCDTGKMKMKRHTSYFGRGALKSLLIQGAQKAFSYGNHDVHIWARKMAANGKPHNVIIVALARKMVVKLWYVLKDYAHDPKQIPQGFERKIISAAQKVKKEDRLETLGCACAAAWAREVIKKNFPEAGVTKPKKCQSEQLANKNDSSGITVGQFKRLEVI